MLANVKDAKAEVEKLEASVPTCANMISVMPRAKPRTRRAGQNERDQRAKENVEKDKAYVQSGSSELARGQGDSAGSRDATARSSGYAQPFVAKAPHPSTISSSLESGAKTKAAAKQVSKAALASTRDRATSSTQPF